MPVAAPHRPATSTGAVPGATVSAPLDFESAGTATTAGPGGNGAPAPADRPAACSLYDSWCAYCGNHPDADLCWQVQGLGPSTGIASPAQDGQPDSGTVLLAPPRGASSVAPAL
jgi:hypothetical protein